MRNKDASDLGNGQDLRFISAGGSRNSSRAAASEGPPKAKLICSKAAVGRIKRWMSQLSSSPAQLAR